MGSCAEAPFVVVATSCPGATAGSAVARNSVIRRVAEFRDTPLGIGPPLAVSCCFYSRQSVFRLYISASLPGGFPSFSSYNRWPGCNRLHGDESLTIMDWGMVHCTNLIYTLIKRL